MLSSLPVEVLAHVAEPLQSSDLKILRLVSQKLEGVARKYLFRSIGVSCAPKHVETFLNIIRGRLFKEVEEIVYKEVYYSPNQVAKASEKLTAHILEYQDGIAMETANPYAFSLLVDPSEQLKLQEMVAAVVADYRSLKQCAVSERDLAALIEAFTMMTPKGLRRLTIRDAQEPGIGTDSGFVPPSIAKLTEYFPVTESMFRNDAVDEPAWELSRGLGIVLRALDRTRLKVTSFVTEQESNVFKYGILPEILHPQYQFLDQCVRGFSCIRRMSLCIRVPLGNENQLTLGPLEFSRWGRLLGEVAGTLEHLEISMTMHGLPSCPISVDPILPVRPFPKLHTLTLENCSFDEEKLIEFLILQATSGALSNLTLWKPSLTGDGRWDKILRALSANRMVYYASFVLRDPITLSSVSAQNVPTQNVPTIHRPLVSPGASALDYINKITDKNPFLTLNNSIPNLDDLGVATGLGLDPLAAATSTIPEDDRDSVMSDVENDPNYDPDAPDAAVLPEPLEFDSEWESEVEDEHENEDLEEGENEDADNDNDKEQPKGGHKKRPGEELDGNETKRMRKT